MDRLCCTQCGAQTEAACACGVAYEFMTLAQRIERRQVKAAELYKGGLTMDQIADRLKVSQQTISDDLRSLPETGKPIRPKGGRPKSSKVTRRAKPEELTAAGLKPTGEGRVRLDTGEVIGKIAAMKLENVAEAMQDQAAIITELRAEVDRLEKELVQRPLVDELLRTRALTHVHRIITDIDTYNLFRRCLHPDSRNSVTDELLHQAWHAYKKLEALTWDKKTAPPPLPETYFDLIRQRVVDPISNPRKRKSA